MRPAFEGAADSWIVFVTTETGLAKLKYSSVILDSKEEADRYASNFKVGEKIDYPPLSFDIISYAKGSQGDWAFFQPGGDYLYPECHRVLVEAGVRAADYGASSPAGLALSKEREAAFIEASAKIGRLHLNSSLHAQSILGNLLRTTQN